LVLVGRGQFGFFRFIAFVPGFGFCCSACCLVQLGSSLVRYGLRLVFLVVVLVYIVAFGFVGLVGSCLTVYAPSIVVGWVLVVVRFVRFIWFTLVCWFRFGSWLVSGSLVLVLTFVWFGLPLV